MESAKEPSVGEHHQDKPKASHCTFNQIFHSYFFIFHYYFFTFDKLYSLKDSYLYAELIHHKGF